MSHQPQNAAEELELLGDFHPLLEQLGRLDGLAELAGAMDSFPLRAIKSVNDLRHFLQQYHRQILQPLELPAIQRAFNHAGRNELRELVACDQQIAGEAVLQSFAPASRRVGQNQLQRLRPLRGERLVQRYLAVVEKGEAHGWHTLVYGLTLAVYSLPLRQGLLGYAQRTTRGFIHSAARPLALSETDCGKLLEELSAGFPPIVDALINRSLAV